jgi:hypothetical protein
MEVHQAPVDLLSARVDAEALLAPVDRLLSIALFTLPPDAKNLSEQAPAKAVGHGGGLGKLALPVVEEAAPVEVGGLADQLLSSASGFRWTLRENRTGSPPAGAVGLTGVRDIPVTLPFPLVATTGCSGR